MESGPGKVVGGDCMGAKSGGGKGSCGDGDLLLVVVVAGGLVGFF